MQAWEMGPHQPESPENANHKSEITSALQWPVAILVRRQQLVCQLQPGLDFAEVIVSGDFFLALIR